MAGKIYKGRLIGWALCMVLVACIPALAAPEPSFSLNIDSLNQHQGVSGTIVLSVANAQGAQIVSIDGMEHFDVLSQSQSSSTSFIRGETSSQLDIYYTVMPKITGTVTMKATIRYDGRIYETNALEITVSENDAGEAFAPDLYIATHLSHTSAYLGEKVIVTYELYTRYNIENYGFTSPLTLDGMMIGEMPENQLKAEYVYLDGVRYARYEMKQLILDPIKPGVYTLPPFNAQVNVITNDGRGSSGIGPFGGLGGFISFSEPVYLQTESRELTVKPLPTEGRPADFSGIVGEPELSGQFSRDTMNYGDSFILQMAVSGRCNLDGLKKVITRDQPGFTVYETLKQSTESVADYQYRAEKTFEAIFVPELYGPADVEPVTLSYFNPVTEAYERTSVPGVTVEVLGEPPSANESGRMAAETVSIEQVSYTLRSDGYLTLQIQYRTLYAVLTGTGALILLTVILFRCRVLLKRRDQTFKTLRKRLKKANGANEIYNALNAMIKHVYGVSVKSCSGSDIQNRLRDSGLAAQVADIMAIMESPEEQDGKRDALLKNRAREVCRMIQKQQKLNRKQAVTEDNT